MNIDHIAESYGSQAIRSAGIEPKMRGDEKKADGAKTAAPGSDKIQISDEAKAMKEKAGLVAAAQSQILRTPDPEMPEAKVRQIFARIMNQHYDSQQVLKSIASSLFEDGIQLAKGSDNEAGISKLNESETISTQQVEEIRQKIDSGFYDQNEIFQVVVRGLFS